MAQFSYFQNSYISGSTKTKMKKKNNFKKFLGSFTNFKNIQKFLARFDKGNIKS